jgi:phosphoribosylaminoimidazolecarboxamide formyltransferase/IMP cyclohydrolase
MNALISVSDKTGILEFAQALHALGVNCCPPAARPTGGDMPVTSGGPHRRFSRMLDGRVNCTLIHGGLLARRDLPEHVAYHQAHGRHRPARGQPLPFEAGRWPGWLHAGRRDETSTSVVRPWSAPRQKNWKDVACDRRVTVPHAGAGRVEGRRQADRPTKFALSVAAFNRISQYDGAISDYVEHPVRRQPRAVAGQSDDRFVKVLDLRYGENSHQRAALYRACTRRSWSPPNNCRARAVV